MTARAESDQYEVREWLEDTKRALQDMGIIAELGSKAPKPTVGRFFNRMLMMDLDTQHSMLEFYSDWHKHVVRARRRAGAGSVAPPPLTRARARSC